MDCDKLTSKLDEQERITYLNAIALINKYATLIKRLKRSKKSKKSIRYLRCSSTSRLSFTSNDETEESLEIHSPRRPKNGILISNKTFSAVAHANSPNCFSLEQYWTMDAVFESIYEKYKNYSWSRLNVEEREVHIAVLKQFWLDCYICDQTFLNLLISPLKNKLWINYDSFAESLRGIHKTNIFHMLSMSIHGKKTKKVFLIQKLLFFFRFVQCEAGSELGRETLGRVLEMADKRGKVQVDMWINVIFKAADGIRGFSKPTINFDEFKNLIIQQFVKECK